MGYGGKVWEAAKRQKLHGSTELGLRDCLWSWFYGAIVFTSVCNCMHRRALPINTLSEIRSWSELFTYKPLYTTHYYPLLSKLKEYFRFVVKCVSWIYVYIFGQDRYLNRSSDLCLAFFLWSIYIPNVTLSWFKSHYLNSFLRLRTICYVRLYVLYGRGAIWQYIFYVVNIKVLIEFTFLKKTTTNQRQTLNCISHFFLKLHFPQTSIFRAPKQTLSIWIECTSIFDAWGRSTSSSSLTVRQTMNNSRTQNPQGAPQVGATLEIRINANDLD